MSNSTEFGHSRRWSRIMARYFPERELILRTEGRVWYAKITKFSQVFGLAIILGVSGWAIFSSFNFFINDRIIASKEGQILNARLTYRNLLSNVSDYQDKFASLTKDLQKNHGLMINLVERNTTLQQNLQTTKTKLVVSKEERHMILSTKEELGQKLSDIESQMNSLSTKHFSQLSTLKNRHFSQLSSLNTRHYSQLSSLNTKHYKLKGNLDNVLVDLESALNERNRARANSRNLESNVSELKSEIKKFHDSEYRILLRLSERTARSITAVESVLKKTGLKLSRLLPNSAANRSSQGGPFIAAASTNEPAFRLKSSLSILDANLNRWDKLQDIVRSIPFAPPLDYFSISSHYGKRRDPINRRWAMHFGMDLGGNSRTRVYSPAPGIVTFAGWKGKYGRLVVIEHGNGFKTRYGHLHKILVKRGQKVDYRAKIGLMGSTGRSTGTHLHYEIIHKGRAYNPWRFIKAGRYVHQE